MTHQFYKLEPGQCICLLGDPRAGARRINVRKMSATEAVLEASLDLKERQFIYATVNLNDGPSLALRGFVVVSAVRGLIIQWTHSHPGEADKVDEILRDYFEKKRLKPSPAAKAAVPSPRTSAKNPAAQEARNERPEVETERRLEETGAAPKLRETARAISNVEGKLDVGASIRNKAKIVKTAELASQIETVRVLGIGAIKSLIKEAVGEAVALLGPSLNEAMRKRLLEETEETFQERFEVFQAEKASLEEKTRLLQGQLEKAQSLLEEERNKVVTAHQFTVSDAGMVELEKRIGRILDHALKASSVSPQLQAEMRSVVLPLLDDEREKIKTQAQEAQNDRIALLEKKVQRLASTLDSAQVERDRAERRAQALEASGGFPLRNIMDAGLDEKDPEKERKLSLLKEIFDFNKGIRQDLASKGLLPKGRKSIGNEASSAPSASAQESGPAIASDEAVEHGKGAAVSREEACGGDDVPLEPEEGPGRVETAKIKKLGGPSRPPAGGSRKKRKLSV